MMSEAPASLSISSQIPSKGLPLLGIKHFGRTSVSGRSRVPVPAAASSAFKPAAISAIDLRFDFFDAQRQVADPPDLTGRGERTEIRTLPDISAGEQRERRAGPER